MNQKLKPIHNNVILRASYKERNTRIVSMICNGWTDAQIAYFFDITRQRAHQLTKKIIDEYWESVWPEPDLALDFFGREL